MKSNSSLVLENEFNKNTLGIQYCNNIVEKIATISPKSNSSNFKLECRYCLCEEFKENLIQPCNCEGSLKYVHNICLGEWIKNSQKSYSLIYENNAACYSSICEICKYTIKYQINFENNFLVSFFYTLKSTFMSIKNFFYFILHSIIVYYFFNRLTFLIYHGIYVFRKNFKTKYLIRFLNEIAIFSTILWYIKDIMLYYGNLFIEQRKGLFVFLPKGNDTKKKQFFKEFSFEMTVEKIKKNEINEITQSNERNELISLIPKNNSIFSNNSVEPSFRETLGNVQFSPHTENITNTNNGDVNNEDIFKNRNISNNRIINNNHILTSSEVINTREASKKINILYEIELK